MAVDAALDFDVVIVGAGFAGALIANELGKAGKRVALLEAGAGIPQDFNAYMERFYTASAKVPESPYTPEIFDGEQLRDPVRVNAGRPTVLSLSAENWKDPRKSYLIQRGPRPFMSTYDRLAGGTSHWLGICLRFVPNDFRMKTAYNRSVDWPISYDDLNPWYGKAEEELGVSADVQEQSYLNIKFPSGYSYPMPKIPASYLDQQLQAALDTAPFSQAETTFLEMGSPVSKIRVRGVPAARNSQPYRNRRACAGNTNCIPICPIQAKYDPTITLNDAINTGSVKFVSHAVAREIIVGGDGRITQIKYLRYRSDRDPTSHEETISGKTFVIAGNAIETARLLLMSKNNGKTINGVANTSDMVGRHLMDHPYYVAWGLAEKQLYPYRGPLITSGIEDFCDGPFRAKRGAFRVDIGNEGWNFLVGGTGGDPNVTTFDFVNGTNHSRINGNASGLLGVDLRQALNQTLTRQFRLGFLVEQTPESENRVTLSEFPDGLGLPRPAITYNLSDYTRKGIVAAKQLKDLIFRRMGITEDRDKTEILLNDPSRFEERIGGKNVTLTYVGAGHIMGTFRMGTDPKHSVVDGFQRSHDHRNLFLVGSGTFPTGATANPTLTIAALSLRTADHILRKDLN
jgi:glucose dehydrogenase